MAHDYNIRTDDMPKDMQVLLGTYPRNSWEAHPGFKAKTMQWLNAHRGFRRLSRMVREDIERVLDRTVDPADHARTLGRFGGQLVGNLHGHHGWEDHVYFPELSAADPRFDAGLELLEKDHSDLDLVLEQFTRRANRVLALQQLEPAQMYDEAGKLLPAARAIEAFLDRHLSDEEELAVPIILHHRLRG